MLSDDNLQRAAFVVDRALEMRKQVLQSCDHTLRSPAPAAEGFLDLVERRARVPRQVHGESEQILCFGIGHGG